MQCIYLKDKSYLVDNLPSEPSLLVELLDLCHNDDANFEMFSAAIRKDAALTAKILQVANSPAYRQWNELTDIRRMLIVLGLHNTRNIVTTCAIQQFFANFTKQFSKNVQLVWLRSLVCANLAERIAELVGYEKPGEVFLAGLLHQIGILLLLLNREDEYLPVLEQYYQQTETFCALEQETLQVDHCELGAALVESWKLDSFLADAILFQHASADELLSSPTLLKILAVASPLSSKNSARDNKDNLEKAGLLFDMTEDTILDCLSHAIEKSKRLIADLGFSGHFYSENNEEELFDSEKNDKDTRKLADEVQNIALSTTIGRSQKSEIVELTKEVRANFSAIFNLEKLLFFTIDNNKTILAAVNDLNLQQLEDIEFRVEDTKSLLVKSFHEKTAFYSQTEVCSITDKQVIRLLKSDAACFFPLHHNDSELGVLVIGVNENEWPRLQNRLPLLKLLCHEIGQKCLGSMNKPPQAEGMSIVDFRKVAHEVSNPLTIINNYLYMLGKKIGDEHSAQEEIKFISEEIDRVGNILLRAKDPQAPEKSKNKQVDVNKLLTELDILFSGSLYKTNNVQSVLLLDKQIPVLSCSKDKLKQIFINIIKNGVEALSEKGTITITTRDNVYQNNRQFVEISIRDDGPGIAEEVLKNLFKPVTSTKEGHSGLGLTIVNSLVQELSGSISCYSRPDYGTEFKILIPRNLKESEIELR